MSSNFNFYVNRQGVQGKRGAKGEQGFSPVISVESQTANEYILKVENEDGSFTTPNLRGNAIENNGGTYIRFNPETGQMYTGFADSATTEQAGVVRMGTYEDLVAGESEELVPNVADVHNFVQNSIGDISGFVTTEQFNAYTTTTDATLLSLSTNKLNTSTYDAYVLETASTLNGLSTNKLDASTFNSYTTTTDAAIGSLDANKLDFTDLTNTLVQGSNVTLTTDAVNKTITISSSGGGGGTQVQADWAETDSADPSFIQNKPTIPAAANDATITITQGGVTKGSFTTNQGTNATIDIDAGGGSSLVAGNGIDINANDEIDIMQEDNIVPATYNWDFNTVGTLTEVDGVYSGFGTRAWQNYLKSKTLTPTGNITSIDASIEITTGSSISTIEVMRFGFGKIFELSFTASQVELGWYTSSSNSRDVKIANYNMSISTNTTYIFNVNFSNGTMTVTFTNKNTGDVTLVGTLNNTSVYLANDSDAYATVLCRRVGGQFTGSFNSNNSYIKINNNLIDMTENAGQSKYCAKATSSLYGLVKPDGSTTQVTNGVISTVNTVQSTTVANIVQITQADYDLLATKDANTLYVIIPASS